MVTRRAFAISCLGSPALVAETRQEKAERLVREAFEAIGGQAFLDVRTQVRAGRAYSFYNRQVRGQARITIYDRFEDMRPDAGEEWLPMRRREVYTEKGDYYALFLNGQGYEVTYRGAVPQPEDYMRRYRLAARRDIFYFMRYRMNEPGLYYYYKGTEIIDNVPCRGGGHNALPSPIRRATRTAAVSEARPEDPDTLRGEIRVWPVQAARRHPPSMDRPSRARRRPGLRVVRTELSDQSTLEQVGLRDSGIGPSTSPEPLGPAFSVRRGFAPEPFTVETRR